ncbi:hypothetical protein EG328_011649 [Venturia inaequalis]|uniref:Uncharacterized protein n=1 Tax=Venturia inaequalis TaxID=5025 RepID=A0A8H3ZCX1_VENIN|nr:hypothetical protein EG328_011649 [Venturia inaequalis]KAE9994479.1 hypothetical protein EG327_009157 [Venturia inaequalis]RDI86312.1 hypothetical protein Vi05172_g3911 [Venturia inaequalis]
MCLTFSTVVGSSRCSKTTTSSYDNSKSSKSSIGSKLDPEPAPSSAEWISSGTTSTSHSHHDATRQEEGQSALSEIEHDLMMGTHQAVVNRRPRNRLSRQPRRQVNKPQQTSPLGQVQNPTDSEMDRQYQEEHASRRPHGRLGRSKAPSDTPSPLISIATSTKQPEPEKKSIFTPSPRAQHASWMDKNPQLAAELREIQPTKKPRVKFSSPTLDTRGKCPGVKKSVYFLDNRTAPSPTQTSSSSASDLSTTSTEATDPPSPRPSTTLPLQNQHPKNCPTFATTFNTMVIHHLRTHWPQPHAPLDIPTREEVLSLIYARLKRLPMGVGREKVNVYDSEEDFIERRALVVAQGVRRDLIQEMGERRRAEERELRREEEERELRRDVETALRYAGGGR